MIIIIAKYIVILFGLFFIGVGFLMLFDPKKTRNILRKAGSTNFINYAEITIRIIPAVALILFSDLSKFPLVLKLVGWFMLATSIVLYFVPREKHHRFSQKSADALRPFYFRLISPFSMLIGSVIIYATICPEA